MKELGTYWRTKWSTVDGIHLYYKLIDIYSSFPGLVQADIEYSCKLEYLNLGGYSTQPELSGLEGDIQVSKSEFLVDAIR